MAFVCSEKDTAILFERSLSSFWARFAGTWGISCSVGQPKLSPDGLGLQRKPHSKTFRTLTLEPLDRNIAPLYFKTEREAEAALRAS